ncbi:hypothetical protein AJ80_01056 [Polytolypa hystricis UAMH7299]|uniref:Lipocalin-like domain-containing protein n=1 Tax=Polytolypa hystricis (strain UAMH7299) TaxID=1447883 RepID=A0A2B7YTH3_POLH7|nr:hypothetical protein AJ80_01056 [Polytolypa hystricis UAMH7299]
MAAPADVTCQDLSGIWVMDKTLSNDTDPIFQMQGMGWLIRKALAYATVTLDITQTKQGEIVHIDVSQTLTGGIKGTDEHRELDWQPREHTDHVFGSVSGLSRMIRGTTGDDDKVRPAVEVQTKVGEAKEDEIVGKFLRGEILADGVATEGFLAADGNDYWVQSFVTSLDSGWTAEQIWGFETINDERRYTRRVAVAKDGKVEKARLVYEFSGKKAQE